MLFIVKLKVKEILYSGKSWVVFYIFSILSIFFCYKIFINFSYLGTRCWDQFVFWNAVPRITILQFRQFPLWNPYVNGGNVLLAHPHSPFLSPLYTLVILFGPVIGLKLQLVLHLIIGMIGMYLLGAYYSFAKLARYLIAFLYMGSSVYFLHMAEGHTEWFVMAFVPWLIYCYLKSFEKKYYIISGIFFLSLIFLGGSVDVFTILLVLMPIFALLKSIQNKAIKPLEMLIYIYVGTFLLCAIKIIPMLEFIINYPRFADSNDCIRLSTLIRMLIDRNQALYNVLDKEILIKLFGIKFRWHEYGSYIGIIPLLFAITGPFFGFKKYWPVIVMALVSLFVSLGYCSPINLWSLLHKMPIYNNLKVHSRFIMGFIFFSSILSGLTFSKLEQFYIKRKKPLRIIPIAILVFIFFDIWNTNAPLLKNASLIPPIRMEKSISFVQKYKKANFLNIRNSLSSLYPILLSNAGNLEGKEVMNIIRGSAMIVSEDGYRGEAYLYNKKGNATIEYFSPNKIVVNVNALEQDILVLNQNFHKGWKAKAGRFIYNTQEKEGLLSFPINKGQAKIVLFYLPGSFLIGSVLSLLFVIFLILRARYFFDEL